MGKLEGWKAIAGFFNCSVRTVQRWEAEAGLPIEREIRNEREAIFAEVQQLESWRESRRRDEPDAGSIVVTPLICEEQSWLGEELAAELIQALGSLPYLRVVGRTTAFAIAKQGKGAREILASVGAELLLEGEVMRDGAVQVRLIGKSGSILWGVRFEGGVTDAWGNRQVVLRGVQAQLRMQVPPAESLIRAGRPKQIESWLKARAWFLTMQPREVLEAIRLMERLIEGDPQCAELRADLGAFLAQAAVLGLHSPQQMLEQSRLELDAALEIDPDHPDALLWKARNLALFEYKWERAGEIYQKVLLLAPNHPHLHYMYGADYLRCLGKYEEAMASLERAIRQDPIHPMLRMGKAQTLAALGRDSKALEEIRVAGGGAGANWMLQWLEGAILLRSGQPVKAFEVLESMHRMAPPFCWAIGTYACACSALGRQEEVERLLVDAERQRSVGMVPASSIGFLLAALGEDEAALDWFETAVAEKDPAIVFQPRASFGIVLTPPIDARLRRRRRWAELESKMGFIA